MPAVHHGRARERIELGGDTRVLFKTRNSALLGQPAYDPDFAAFSLEAARALVRRGVTWWDSTTSPWRTRTSRCPCTAHSWTTA